MTKKANNELQLPAKLPDNLLLLQQVKYFAMQTLAELFFIKLISLKIFLGLTKRVLRGSLEDLHTHILVPAVGCFVVWVPGLLF